LADQHGCLGVVEHIANRPIQNALNRFINHMKQHQKKFPRPRRFAGQANFVVIRSCLDTLHKQGHRMMEVLRRAFYQDAIVPAGC
jgi:transposase